MADLRETRRVRRTAPGGVSLRDQLCDAATEVLVRDGWGKVTMARLADEVGVSRQTVYNEIGTKTDLAEALVMLQLQRFLGEVTHAFDDHPDDLVEAIRESAARVLAFAQDNALLHAVVSATHGADTELLPLLTTHSEHLLAGAKAAVAERVAGYPLALDAAQREACIDMVVRLVLSHVMQPSGEPEATAADIAFIADRVLR